MELIYLWINKSEHDIFIHQQVNISPEYNISVDDPDCPHKITLNKSANINIFKSSKIENISALIGSNGAGKTTLMSYIAHSDVLKPRKPDSGYERFSKEEYEGYKSIHVYFNEKNSSFLIYHNLESSVEVDNNTDYIYEVMQYTGEDESAPPLFDILDHSIVYLSNSYYVPNSFNSFSRAERIRNYSLHLAILEQISKEFYSSLYKNDTIFCRKTNFDDLATQLLKRGNLRRFQQILDIVYYKYLIDSDALKNNDMIGIICDKLYISFNYLPSLIPNFIPKPDVFKQKIEAFNSRYIIRSIKTISIVNILYLNLLFEVFYYSDEITLPTIDITDCNFYDVISGIIKNENYVKYLDEIHQMEMILNKCYEYPNLIDNKDDLARRNDKVVDYNKDKETYIEFISFITELYNKQDSYVLRYINIDNLSMSSGERAVQNLFSWLISIPSFERIMNGKQDTKARKLLLMIDEIDLYAHPEWQRKIINYLITVVEKLDYEKIQIILSSHSPLILSDFPKCNIIFLYKNESTMRSIIDNTSKHKETLCSNLYSLLNDSFFLSEGMVGEFSRNLIIGLFEELKSGKKEHGDDYYDFIIKSIGDKAVKNEFIKIYNFKDKNNETKSSSQMDYKKLKEIKQELERSLKEIQKIIGEDND